MQVQLPFSVLLLCRAWLQTFSITQTVCLLDPDVQRIPWDRDPHVVEASQWSLVASFGRMVSGPGSGAENGEMGGVSLQDREQGVMWKCRNDLKGRNHVSSTPSCLRVVQIVTSVFSIPNNIAQTNGKGFEGPDP